MHKSGAVVYRYNKAKESYNVNFDTANILIGVRLQAPRSPFEKALSQPLASNATLSSHKQSTRWIKDYQRDRDLIIVLFYCLLAALRYNKNQPSGITLFLWEHGNHSNRGLSICQQL